MPFAIAILLLVLAVSALGAVWLVRRKTAEKAVKIMMFVGYFWLLTFFQVSLIALFYSARQHFFPV
ncbi:hypothetical protein [Methylomonas sp. MgM2]